MFFKTGGGESDMGKDEINAFLGSSTVYNGKLTFQGAVRIDGMFTGEIISDGALIVGKDAIIDGTLEVGELILSGTFTGTTHASRRVTIHRTGSFQGQLHSPALVVEEGAKIEGKISMGSEQTKEENQAEKEK